MNWKRVLGWLVVAFLTLAPVNWIVLAVQGKAGPSVTGIASLVGAVLVSWALAGAFAYAMLRGIKRQAQEVASAQDALAEARRAPLQSVQPTAARLKAYEVAYVAVPAELKAIKTVGFKAGTAGMSVRVAKGVTVRTASTQGGAVRDLVTVARGELVVTDRRVIFAGDAKSLALNLDQILNVTYYLDGVGVNDNTTSHTFVVASELEAARLHGVMVRIIDPNESPQ